MQNYLVNYDSSINLWIQTLRYYESPLFFITLKKALPQFKKCRRTPVFKKKVHLAVLQGDTPEHIFSIQNSILVNLNCIF